MACKIEYYCDHCKTRVDDRSKLPIAVAVVDKAREVHFCYRCSLDLLAVQIDKLEAGHKDNFLSYYRGKGLTTT